MHAWEAIQTSLDYIKDHLKEDITIEQLANLSGLSVFYFQRLFTRLVKKSVFEYIKARRVADAKKELRDSDKRILDIALDYGFASHEHFTRNFKAIYDITPEAYRKGAMKLTDFLKPDLSLRYTMIDENVPLIVDDMILEICHVEVTEELYFTGYRKVVDASEMNKVGENTLVTLWNQFNSTKASIPNLKKDGVAIDYFTHALQPGKVEYFVGGESSEDIPSHFHHIVMEKGRYIVCSFESEDFEHLVSDALYKANGYFFETWLPQKHIEMQDMKPFLIQKYLNVDCNPKIEIWIQPLKNT